jgi:hypothetical protein
LHVRTAVVGHVQTQLPVTLELYARTAGYDFRIEAAAPDIHGATTTTAAAINAINPSVVVPAMKLLRQVPRPPTQGRLASSADYTLCI